MKKSITFFVYTLSAILMSLFVNVGCSDDDTEPKYELSLEVHPEERGDVTGSGEYTEGEEVSIAALPDEGWLFVNWSGDTEQLNDEYSAETIVTMPAQNISLTANFEEEVSIIYGDGVTDIDGNEYVTVIVGNQEWMAENLRVTRYNNEDSIPTGISDAGWGNTTEGAYAIYPHEGGITEDNVEGINSDEEMVAAYGKLYNWYAVDDSRGLCPEGWSVPRDYDWTLLVNYIMEEYDYHNNWQSDDIHGVSNALKSCRQDGSPLGGDCDTSEHPRWNSHGTHYGFDEFGFSALPGGNRGAGGGFLSIGKYSLWWSSSEHSSTQAWRRLVYLDAGDFHRGIFHKTIGFSVRCFRDVD